MVYKDERTANQSGQNVESAKANNKGTSRTAEFAEREFGRSRLWNHTAKQNKTKKPKKETSENRWFAPLMTAGLVAVASLSVVPYVDNFIESHTLTFDQQEVVIFVGKYKSLAVDVDAVRQKDKNIQTATYLLNGMTELGWWYQVGVNEDKSIKGFDLSVQIFSKDGNKIEIDRNVAFSGTVNPGDTVKLSMDFKDKNLAITATDLETGAKAEFIAPAHGSYFVGNKYQAAFTGVMTEIYHSGKELQVKENPVTYSIIGPPVKAFASIDVWYDIKTSYKTSIHKFLTSGQKSELLTLGSFGIVPQKKTLNLLPRRSKMTISDTGGLVFTTGISE